MGASIRPLIKRKFYHSHHFRRILISAHSHNSQEHKYSSKKSTTAHKFPSDLAKHNNLNRDGLSFVRLTGNLQAKTLARNVTTHNRRTTRRLQVVENPIPVPCTDPKLATTKPPQISFGRSVGANIGAATGKEAVFLASTHPYGL